MKRFNAFLRSRAATTIFLLSAIAAQTPHAAYVFHATANDSHVTAWLAAFALESAVLHFVIHGQRRVSYLFASVSVAMNLAYYQMHGVDIFALQGVTAWLLSIALPVAIAFYSHSIAEQASADTKTQADASEPAEAPTAPVSPSWAVTPIAQRISPLRPAESLMVDSAMISTATKAESVAIVADDNEIAPDDVANVPHSIASVDEPTRRETGIERAMRREAERKAQADELRGLTVEERRERLRKMRTNGHASTPKSELAQLFDVNPSTITRDLQALGLQ